MFPLVPCDLRHERVRGGGHIPPPTLLTPSFVRLVTSVAVANFLRLKESARTP
jgi:hypothetical protein